MTRHQSAILAEFGRAVSAKREECAARRDRVLEYVDLRQRLCEPPLNFRQPEDWNGYVPPATTVEGELNTSPRRRALVEISAEAMRREREEQGLGA